MNKFTLLKSRAVLLPLDHVDTDQIIPARFLKVTDKTGLGEKLFSDWRYLPDGSPKPDFVLNKPESRGAAILVAGDNFGCGSSREHAPWALTGFGFRAIISTSFADIFRNNALKNGLLPVVVSPDYYHSLLRRLENEPQSELEIDLGTQTLKVAGEPVAYFPIDDFSKTCLLNGVDELGYLLGLEEQISAYEKSQMAV
ncbi:MAG: 3-isopropylmalate dehydratase small subunit [Anaerolineaceae bacterium]|nr:3-isopropylmalate dehydratase small subunit [Anaerolineaceae bacterium]